MMRRLSSAVALSLVLGLLVSGCGLGGSKTTVVAEFTDAAGLFEGNDVGVLGVRVGKVTKIDPVGPKVRLTLEIDDGVKIPAGAGAVIVSRSVATDRYVELTPVYTGGKVLRSGTTIGLAKTRNPIEFDEVLASVDELASAVAGPKKDASALDDLITVGSDVLDGNGERIGATVSNLAAALETFNDGSQDATAVLSDLDSLTNTLAKNDATVRLFADQLTDATDLLDDDKELLTDTFGTLSEMLRKVAVFVKNNRAQINSQLDNITELSQTVLEHEKGLSELVETFPLLMQNASRAVDDGRLTMKLRPGDLLPGETTIKILCNELPAGLCDGLNLQDTSFLDILQLLAGVTP